MNVAAIPRTRPVPSRRVLEPVERLSEVLFGLIMVLTFTGSLSVAEAGRDDVRAMLIGALGCNLAWGIIDGVLYLEAVRQRLMQLPEPPAQAQLGKDDWLGAVGIFLLVFLCTFPVVIPFLFMRNAGPALRVSNAIAIVMLFLTGYAFGRMSGRHPWLVGFSMVILGLILVGMTMALGG